jgi:TonB-linked SusC/RagA family outer membrane protein
MGVVGLLLALALPPLGAQQQGSITGKVTDEGTGQPLAGARVQVIGASAFALTNAQGVYAIRAIAAGSYQLRVVLIGYASIQRTVTVEAGQPVTADWVIRGIPYTLEEIVTTATGEQLTRELGNTVARMDAKELVEIAPVSSLTQVLSGRIAGLNVLQSNGVTGQGARIRIRGLSSVSLSNDPQVYLDGVRINISQSAPSFFGGAVSFLNDLNPEDIEDIEVVKGPAASTLYGTQAANGVIKITTKRGRAGAAQWNVWLEGGLLKDTYTYPSTWFSARQGSTTLPCFPYQQALGQCQISQLYELRLLETDSTTPYGTGNREQFGTSVAGGSDIVRYFISAEYERELGLLKIPDNEVGRVERELGIERLPFVQRRPNEMNKYSGRVNLSASPTNKLELALAIGAVRNRLRLPQVGDNFETIIGTPLLGSANPNLPEAARYGFARPAEAAGEETYRTSNHVTNSLTATWRTLNWLTARGTVGMDFTQFDDEQNVRNGQGCIACSSNGFSERLGKRFVQRNNNTRLSADLNSTAIVNLTSRIGSKTSAGAQYNFDHLFWTNSQGSVLPPGILSINAGANKFTNEATVETKTLGLYVEQQFGLDDRLFVTGAVRFDANSAFGQESRSATYPKVAGSWVGIEGRRGWLNDLRLRAAYGVSGVQPNPTDALTFESPVTASILGALSTPAVVLGQLGDENLKPERSREVEAGVDLGLLDNKVRLEVTVFDKTTKDALVRRNLPPSLGATVNRLENIGTVNNKGIEISLNARPVESPNFTWDLNIEAAGFKNRLKSLAPGVPNLTGFGYQQRPDYPLAGLWWPALLSFDDKNGDGFIDPSEVVKSDTAVFLGNTVPTRQLYVTNAFSLFRDRVRVSFLGEYKGGNVGLEINTGFMCLFQLNCRALHDPTTPLVEQARAVAGSAAFGAYALDASFFRLREASITYNAPTSFARFIGARTFNATVTGRNLLLFTGWPSWDPENHSASTSDFVSYNFLVQRQPTVVTLRFNLGY